MQCMQRLSTSTPQAIMDKYDFPQLRNAAVLRSRAKGESTVAAGIRLLELSLMCDPMGPLAQTCWRRALSGAFSGGSR